MRRSAQQSAVNQALVNLGVNMDVVNRLQAQYGLTDIALALEYAIKTDQGWLHLFIPSFDNPEACEICGDHYDQHRHEDVETLTNRTQPAYPRLSMRMSSTRSDVSYRKSYGERECPICFEKEQLQAYLPCGHEFCKACVTEYLNEEIKVANVLHMTCTDFECAAEFPESTIQQLVDNQTFQKYEQFVRNALADLDASTKWCPTPNCDSILKGSKENPKMICPKCEASTWFSCNEPWHEGKSCEEAQDENLIEWSKGRDVQSCPQCQRVIEKDHGCNHMTCIGCNYEFCWLCRRQYTTDHFQRYPWQQFTGPEYEQDDMDPFGQFLGPGGFPFEDAIVDELEPVRRNAVLPGGFPFEDAMVDELDPFEPHFGPGGLMRDEPLIDEIDVVQVNERPGESKLKKCCKPWFYVLCFPLIAVIFLIALLVWPPHEANKRILGRNSSKFMSIVFFLAYPFVILYFVFVGIRYLFKKIIGNDNGRLLGDEDDEMHEIHRPSSFNKCCKQFCCVIFFPIIAVIFLLYLIFLPPHEAARKTFGTRSTYWHSFMCFLAYPLLILRFIWEIIGKLMTHYCEDCVRRFGRADQCWVGLCCPITFPVFCILLLFYPPRSMARKYCGWNMTVCWTLVWFALYPLIILIVIWQLIRRGYEKFRGSQHGRDYERYGDDYEQLMYA